MNTFEFIINDTLYALETQDDVLEIIRFMLDDEEITAIDRKARAVHTHYGRWWMDKILEDLKLSGLLTVVKFSNLLEDITDETDINEECSNL